MKTNSLIFSLSLFTFCMYLMGCATTNIPENHTIIESNRGTISISKITVEDEEIIPGSLTGGFDSLRIEYPDMCWTARIDGTVTLFIDIDEGGEPIDVKVMRGIGGGCDEAAWRTFRNATYKPAISAEGSAVSERHWVSVTFSR